VKCEDLLRALNDYVDGDIDPAVCEAFAGHLADCNPCQVVVDNIRQTITLYREQGAAIEVPIRFRDSLRQELRRRWCEKFPPPAAP